MHLVFKDQIDAIKSLAGSKDRTVIEKAAQSWGDKVENIKKHETNTLETKIKTRTIDLTTTTEEGDTAVIDYLMPREWYYFFCVENPTNQVTYKLQIYYYLMIGYNYLSIFYLPPIIIYTRKLQ